MDSIIKITCPDNNRSERTYAIDALLIDVLGFSRNDYDIQFIDGAEAYVLDTCSKQIVVEDHFFNIHKTSLSYLTIENVPKTLAYFHCFNQSLPIVYGVDKFIQEENRITIGLDVFASTFFMLTRWEEYLIGREESGDCDESLLFTVKNGISSRPIVDEYGALIKYFLKDDDDVHFPKKRVFDVVLTHDVDAIITPTWKQLFCCLFKRVSLRKITFNKSLTWWKTLQYKLLYPDEFSQFRLYSNLATCNCLSEWFYFKVCKSGEKEATYSFEDNKTINVVSLLKRQKNLKKMFGFHPSQSTFNNPSQWKTETTRIQELLGQPIKIGRNHHLLYNHDMLLLWESLSRGDEDILISNSVFHSRLGFRSGITGPYRLFDCFLRRPMKLIEYPCHIMDTAIMNHKYFSESEAWEDIKSIIDAVKLYNGVLVLTWHILIRDPRLLKQYFKLCEKAIEYARMPLARV